MRMTIGILCWNTTCWCGGRGDQDLFTVSLDAVDIGPVRMTAGDDRGITSCSGGRSISLSGC